MTVSPKKTIKLIARLLVTAVLLAWILHRVELAQLERAIVTARWQFLAGTWMFSLLFSITQSKALQIILRQHDCPVRLNTLFGATVATTLYSMFLPGMLSTGVKWYILKKETGRGTHVLSSMVYNQMVLFVTITTVGLIAIVTMDLTALLDVSPAQNRTLQGLAVVLLIGMILFCVLFLNLRTGAALMRVMDRWFGLLPSHVRLKGGEMVQQLAAFQTAGPAFHCRVVTIDVLAVLLLGIPTYLCAARAAGISVPLDVFVFLHAGVFVLSKLPVTIANLGLREVTVVGVMVGHGVSPSSALLMSMILFSSQIFLAALGVVYQFAWAIQSKKPLPPT